MTFLEMSFVGAVMIAAVAIIRLVLINRLPKLTFVILWSLVALRLLVPFQITSPWSLYSLPPVAHLAESLKIVYDERFTGQERDKIGKFAAKVDENAADQSDLLNPAGQAGFNADTEAGGMGNISVGIDGNPKQSMTGQNGQSDQPDQSQQPNLSDQSALPAGKGAPGQAFPWSVIWRAGCLLCAGWYAYNYFRYRRWFAASLPVEDEYVKKWLARRGLRRLIQVRQIAGLGTPLTYGILHPTILLPKRMDWDNKQQLEYVLTHEYVHIRRLDAAAKLVWIAALCLHWFNPFVWLMYVLCNRDLELACDEAVVRIFGEESRAGYARALIGMEETKRGLQPLYNGFSQNATEERITAIMKTRKLTIFAVIIAVLLVTGVTAVFATSGRKAKEAENTEESLAAEKGTAQNHMEELEQEMQELAQKEQELARTERDLTRTEQELAQMKEQLDMEKTIGEARKAYVMVGEAGTGSVYINEEMVMAQNHME